MSTSTELRQLREEATLPLQRLRGQIDELIGDLRDGSRDIESVLLYDVDQAISATYVAKLIEVVPGVGKVGARRLLAGLSIGETEKTGTLSIVQRRALLKLVAQRNADHS